MSDEGLAQPAGRRLANLNVVWRFASRYPGRIVAAFIAHGNDPFQAKMPALLFGILSGGLMLTGAGRFSLDALLCRRCCEKTQAAS